MSSQWMEVKVETDPESAESVADLFQRFGHQGVLIEREGFAFEVWEEDVPPPTKYIVRAYFPLDERTSDIKQQIQDALRYLNMIQPVGEAVFSTLDEQDWAEAWKKHYQPLRVGQHLLIRPRWITDLEIEPEDIVISLDPGMAFGTGTHPSTQLCLEATEELQKNRPSLRVLDLGCGSGILSIAAAKLGAVEVVALDTDPIAVKTTIENAEENNVSEQIQALKGSLETVLRSARRFDIALVNILAKVIIQMCDQGLGQILRPGGIGVFGGIITEQAEEVETALRQTGLEPYKRRISGEWVVIEARRPIEK
ncbi:MAG: 50S ribosomal protein L11 methyltransferase [Phototrophicales bacterium]|nr:MAG: 50S ribosomal protein L11 methyltransferase [Phototrophicales bacterium]